MDIQTELRQLELMDPRHDNIYARILDWLPGEIESQALEHCEGLYDEWDKEKDGLEREIDSLKGELADKNAEIDRLVALVDELEAGYEGEPRK